jgi:hypothetical protein
LNNIIDPMTGGAWEGDLRNRGSLEPSDLKPLAMAVSGLTTFDIFIQARKALFTKFQE